MHFDDYAQMCSIIPHKFSHPSRRVCRVSTAQGANMHVEIVQNGKVLSQYFHGGKTFIEAPSEGDYIIRLTNRSGSRRLAVVSVDGRNVIDGETAGFDGPGYVLREWETVEIPGWRRSDSKVAKFEFKPQDQSYAAQIGDGTSNTGVIGIAIFAEKKPVWKRPQTRRVTTTTIINEVYGSTSFSDDDVSAALPAFDGPNAAAALDSSQTLGLRSRRRLTKNSAPEIGTGYGSESTMHTQETTFERASKRPFQVLTFQYAVRAKLVEWGVQVAPVIPEPNPFPGSETASVPAPPGWRG